MAPVLLLAGSLGLLGCGSGGGGTTTTGQFSVSLGSSPGNSAASALNMSAPGPSGDIQAAFVTIDKVEVHLSGDDTDNDHEDQEAGMASGMSHGDDVEAEDQPDQADDEEGSWMTVATSAQTVNLMDLQNCLLEKLGSAKLPAGQFVTQIRLILASEAPAGQPFANYVLIGGQPFEIKVPSGFETGIKIDPEGPVAIQGDGEVHVTLLIDLDKSLVFTGEGAIIFKPVILAKTGGEDADAFVSGQVTNAADGTVIAGASVSAAVTGSNPVKVENATTTDVDGNYRFCVAPGTYDVTAAMTGFVSSTHPVTVSGEETATANFGLTAQPQ